MKHNSLKLLHISMTFYPNNNTPALDFHLNSLSGKSFVKNQLTREVFFHPLFLTGINLPLKLEKVGPKQFSRIDF